MSDSGTNSPRPGPSKDTWIDQICDQFEDRCRAGSPPVIDRFLQELEISEEKAGPDLLEELRRVEAAYRLALANESTRSPALPPEAMPTGTFPLTAGANAPLVEGTVIDGRYHLRQKLGTGGMGVVWRATQTHPVSREVALKLIREGIDSKSVLARFDAERQALAMMDNPNIARVFDGGTTSGGQPFFVMELVAGVPITEFCDHRELPLNARLELFVMVCHAIQHAHQKGIIHRDIKPGNVLVTEVDGKPTPKVIDFGVAKAIEFELTQLTVGETCLVGTPAYMSPEQANPATHDIDTRSDIFSLGVLLYELLTGSPPLDAGTEKRRAIQEMLRLVREAEPSKPSARIDTITDPGVVAFNRHSDPEQLKKALRGDLDWITLKSLEKERKRRYDTAKDFAADIERHLQNEPVLAAPPSQTYRLRKFVRKNRAPVIAASLLAISLVSGAVGTVAGLFQAQRQTEIAKKAEEVAKTALVNEAGAMKELSAKVAELSISTQFAADAAFENNRTPHALQLLSQIDPKNRNIEWHLRRRRFSGAYATLYGHKGAVYCVAFSPDGSRIASGSEDSTIKIWDSTTGLEIVTLRGHSGSVIKVAFGPDGNTIVSGSRDETIRIWDVESGQQKTTIGPLKGLSAVALSFDGKRIASGKWDFKLVIDFSRKKAEARKQEYNCDQIDYGDDHNIRIWDVSTGKETTALKGHTCGIVDLAFSPDGRWITSSSLDQSVKIWNTATEREHANHVLNENFLTGVSYSPDGLLIAINAKSQSGSRAIVLDAKTGKEKASSDIQESHFLAQCRFSPDGRSIATTSNLNIKLSDAESGNVLQTLRGHTNEVNDAAFSPDGSILASCSSDTTLKIWDLSSSPEKATLKGHSGEIVKLKFSADGKKLLSNSLDHSIILWNCLTGEKISTMTGHADTVESMFFSPDEKSVVSSSYDNTVKVWEAATGTMLFSKERHESLFGRSPYLMRHAIFNGAAKFSADGESIESHCVELFILSQPKYGINMGPTKYKHIKKFDAVSGVENSYVIKSLYWAEDDNTFYDQEIKSSKDNARELALSSEQTESGFLKILDASARAECIDLKTNSRVTIFTFSPAGDRVAAGLDDTNVIVWDASREMEVDEARDVGPMASTNPDNPTKNGRLRKDELARRKAKAAFRPAEANEEYQKAKTPYAKAFWKSRFAFNLPNNPKHWEEFQNECREPSTWRLMVKTCDLILQRGPAVHAEKYRAWAEEKLRTEIPDGKPVPLK